MEKRFFKCNVLGGFRLSDLNKNIRQNEYFYVDGHIADASHAISSALKARWMVEVSEKEASKHISIPKNELAQLSKSGIRDTNIGIKGAVNRSINVAIPDVKTVNRNLESRQSEANKLDQKLVIPNFKEVEEKIKNRDSINKLGASSDAELLNGLKDVEKAIGPDFAKVAEKKETKKEAKEEIEEKEEVAEIEEDITELKVDEKKEEIVVNALSDDSVFDNTGVSTPNFDEKKSEVKIRKKREKRNIESNEKLERPKRIYRKKVTVE